MSSCPQCQSGFEVTNEDLTFYEKIGVPEPSLCPDCRLQRRLTFRNERHLYQRPCGLTGKNIISIYAADKKNKVYEQEVWRTDQWNALSYGRNFDFSRPFFDQFQDLFLAVPHPASGYRFGSENCDYTTYQNHSKNCYLTFGSGYMEDCAYTNWTYYAKNCLDALGSEHIEWCYELVDCNKMYGCTHCQDSSDLTDSHYCYDCHSCQDCFGCVGLKQKRFCFLNEQLSEKEYREKISNKSHQPFLKEWEALKLKTPRRPLFKLNTEESSGDHLVNCKKVMSSFYSSDSQDCAYNSDVINNKDSWDCSRIGETELSYECLGGGFYYHCKYCIAGEELADCDYCFFCFNSKNLFGCVGIRRKEYCILNKQYTKEDYEQMVVQIVEHMKKTGEWGQFFPAKLSPFGYNESVAQEYIPLTQEEALKQGFTWFEYEAPLQNITKIIPAAKLPETIDKIPDDVLNWAIQCEATGRPFKIIAQELAFYRKQNLPLPRLHPDERHKRRLLMRNPKKLWQRACAQCQKPISSVYGPDRPEIVWCEECYLREVY